jgi:hypothetical protein
LSAESRSAFSPYFSQCIATFWPTQIPLSLHTPADPFILPLFCIAQHFPQLTTRADSASEPEVGLRMIAIPAGHGSSQISLLESLDEEDA